MPFSSFFPFPHIDIEKLFCFTGNAVEADNCQNSVDPWEVMKQVDVEKRLKGVEAIWKKLMLWLDSYFDLVIIEILLNIDSKPDKVNTPIFREMTHDKQISSLPFTFAAWERYL